MDVSIKLSLAGGHFWDFVCDEDDPMVMGIISALPGAAVDKNLPPDGLVQVEHRSGERLFFSRSSLVSVAIRRLPQTETHVAMAMASEEADAFLFLPQALGALTIEAILAMPEFNANRAGLQNTSFDLPTLPDSAIETLIAAATRGASALTIGTEQPTQLDIHALKTEGGPLPQQPGSLLAILAVLAAPQGVAVTVPADKSPSGRLLHLMEGDLLMVLPSTGNIVIQPNGKGEALLLTASLSPRSDPGEA